MQYADFPVAGFLHLVPCLVFPAHIAFFAVAISTSSCSVVLIKLYHVKTKTQLFKIPSYHLYSMDFILDKISNICYINYRSNIYDTIVQKGGRHDKLSEETGRVVH